MTNEEFLIEAIVKAGCEEYGGSLNAAVTVLDTAKAVLQASMSKVWRGIL